MNKSKKKYTKENQIGKIYGHLEIVDFIEHAKINGKKVRARVIVKCLACHNKLWEIPHHHLIKKVRPTKSCGCINPGRTSHGMRHHPYYTNCCGAIIRCKPNSQHSEYYHDRGIVCHWDMKHIADFIKYLEINLPPRKDGESLDRIDNNKGYEPGNLRWASKKEQTTNRRKNITNKQFDSLKKENALLREEIGRLQKQIQLLGLRIL